MPSTKWSRGRPFTRRTLSPRTCQKFNHLLRLPPATWPRSPLSASQRLAVTIRARAAAAKNIKSAAGRAEGGVTEMPDHRLVKMFQRQEIRLILLQHQPINRAGFMGRPSWAFSLLAPDTVSRVIQPAARRDQGSSPQPTVNNSAATKNLRPGIKVAGRIALTVSQSSTVSKDGC